MTHIELWFVYTQQKQWRFGHDFHSIGNFITRFLRCHPYVIVPIHIPSSHTVVSFSSQNLVLRIAYYALCESAQKYEAHRMLNKPIACPYEYISFTFPAIPYLSISFTYIYGKYHIWLWCLYIAINHQPARTTTDAWIAGITMLKWHKDIIDALHTTLVLHIM